MAASKKTKPLTTEKATAKKPRKLRAPKYSSFRLQKRVKSEVVEQRPLATAPKLFKNAIRIMLKNWKLFGGILLLYAVLNIVLVGGLSGSGLAEMKQNISDVFTGNFGQLSGGLALFAFLISTPTTNGSAAGPVYQTLLLLVMSLALIWALRQVYADHTVKIREAFYRGMYPLIPFILVLFAIGVQLLPFVVGGFLYNLLVGSGVVTTFLEHGSSLLIFFLLGVLSLYMVISSIFALYVVTLPDMTPMKALRSARELVLYRRLRVLRKLLFLPIALLVVSAIIMLPIVIFATVIATPIFFVLSVIGVALVHAYMYGLYRELIA